MNNCNNNINPIHNSDCTSFYKLSLGKYCVMVMSLVSKSGKILFLHLYPFVWS